MKNIYLVQTNSVFGSDIKSTYLPYAIGTIAAYSWADERIKNSYVLKKLIFMRDDVEQTAAGLEDPYLVGLSCYVWSMEYNKALAQKIKERFPNCLIMMGGHSISPDAKELREFDYVDFLVHNEGEEPTKQLLLALAENGDLSKVNNISFRNADGEIVTTPAVPAGDVANYPSPYLEGYFDEIIKDKSMSFSAIWETNRGCPNKCAYCDWGGLKTKVRFFSMERCAAEIEWFSKNKIEYIYNSDANFGMFDRDEELVDMLIAAKQKTGYPQQFKTSFSKNRADFVFKLSCKMYDAGMGKSPSLSFQTMSEEALENVGRKNMSLDYFKSLMQMYNSRGIIAFSELILGLPGETYDSFASGIENLLICGEHKNFIVYPCELLPNSLLGSKEAMEKFKIKAQTMEFRQHHCALDPNSVQEYVKTIISTYSMSVEDWKRAYIFSMYTQGLHVMCLTMLPAIYAYYEKGVGYKRFYEEFIQWSAENPDTLCGELYYKCAAFTDDVAAGTDSFKRIFEEFGDITWGYDDYLFLKAALNPERFFGEFSRFFARYGVDGEIAGQLLKYQRCILKKMNMTSQDYEFDYDFEEYFENVTNNNPQPLRKVKNIVTVTEDNPVDSVKEYARQYVWYGRRVDAPIYSSKRNNLKVKYID